MASRADIEAGRAHVLLYAKDQLTSGLSKAMAVLRGFGMAARQVGIALIGLGTAAAAGIAACVKHFTDFGSKLNDASERTGVAASKLAEFGYAADQTGASLEDVVTAINKAQKAGKDFDAVLQQIANTSDPAEKTRLAMEAFGKSGGKLIPMINNLKTLREEARAKGLVPTDEAVRMADELGDKFSTVFQQLKMGMFEISAAWAPIILPLVDAVSDLLSSTLQWIRANGELMTSFGGIGDAIAGGNWGLAGEIAIKQIQLAFQTGLAAITNLLLDGPLADAIGTIGTKLIKGDLQGAWDSVAKAMAATWDALVLGMVSAFKSAVGQIRTLLNSVADQLSGTLRAVSALIRSRATTDEARTGAAFLTNPLELAAGQIDRLKVKGNDKLGEIESTAGMVQNAALKNAIESMREHLNDAAGGSEEAAMAAADLAAELAKLQEQAKREKEARLAKFKEGPGKLGGEDLGGRTFATFSAAALMATVGAAPSKEEKMATAMDTLSKDVKFLVGLGKGILDAIKRPVAGLGLAP